LHQREKKQGKYFVDIVACPEFKKNDFLCTTMGSVQCPTPMSLAAANNGNIIRHKITLNRT
jgi:hypothetical protein